jgi:nucleotide-binding universal stress UspA family protein
MFGFHPFGVMPPRSVASRARRLLVATGLGPASEEAIRAAVDWADLSGGEVSACHVGAHLERGVSLLPHAEVSAPGTGPLAERRSAVRRQLRSVLGRRGADVPIYVAGGEPGPGIAAAAEALRPDLLVVGAPRGSGPTRLAFDSVAENLVKRTRCAVLAVRPATGTGGILVAPDLSDDPPGALRAAAGVARTTGGRVTIVHALSPMGEWGARVAAGGAPMPSPGWLGDVDGELGPSSPSELLRGLGVDCEARIYREDPVAALLESVEVLRPELCVVAMDAGGRFTHRDLGDAARILMRACDCSVLVVRPARATA